MIDINFKADVAAVERKLTADKRKHIPKAVSMSINRAISSVRTEAKRQISKDMGINQKRVKDSLIVKHSSPTSLIATLIGLGRPIKLIYFKGTRKQGKIGVKSGAYGVTKTYRGAFITKVGSHTGAFARKGKDSLPIKELYGPSVPKTMDNKKIQSAMDTKGRNVFIKEFKRNLKRLIK